LKPTSLSERYAMIAFHAHGASPARKEYAKLPMVGTLQIDRDQKAGLRGGKRQEADVIAAPAGVLDRP
jgi:hypothetical protein